MPNQDPKDQKPLTDSELAKAAGGGAGVTRDDMITAGENIAQPAPTPPYSLEESGMTPETYYALFPAAKPPIIE